MPPGVYIAQTDSDWFDYLRSRPEAVLGRIDEVNFWSPSTTKPLKNLRLGEPVFLRLMKGRDAIAGYGFFATHVALGLRDAWISFGWRNGDPDELRFLTRIGRFRGLDLIGDPTAARARLGCTVLRDVRLWPPDRWLAWGRERGWKPHTQRGATERNPAHIELLLARIQGDHAAVPAELVPAPFRLVEADERRLVAAQQIEREGQGTFRARLLRAYGGRCAVTGEHTEIVLDAAHIQPYLGPASNHPQNGLLLTKEFHALFDAGYVTITAEHEVRVSSRLYDEWGNGHRYRPFDGARLRAAATVAESPSAEALDWHARRRFRG